MKCFWESRNGSVGQKMMECRRLWLETKNIHGFKKELMRQRVNYQCSCCTSEKCVIKAAGIKCGEILSACSSEYSEVHLRFCLWEFIPIDSHSKFTPTTGDTHTHTIHSPMSHNSLKRRYKQPWKMHHWSAIMISAEDFFLLIITIITFLTRVGKSNYTFKDENWRTSARELSIWRTLTHSIWYLIVLTPITMNVRHHLDTQVDAKMRLSLFSFGREGCSPWHPNGRDRRENLVKEQLFKFQEVTVVGKSS